jgi:hypothetical protein
LGFIFWRKKNGKKTGTDRGGENTNHAAIRNGHPDFSNFTIQKKPNSTFSRTRKEIEHGIKPLCL